MRSSAQRLQRRQFPPLSRVPFIEAKRLGKACVYDLPSLYYPAWEKIQAELSRKYSDWMPSHNSKPIYLSETLVLPRHLLLEERGITPSTIDHNKRL